MIAAPMKLLLPISPAIDLDANLRLPFTLIKTADACVILEHFTEAEKAEFFGVERSQKNEHGGWQNRINMGLGFGDVSVMDRIRAMDTGQKIVISKDTNNPAELQAIQQTLDFLLRVAIGRGLPFTLLKEAGGPYYNARGSSGPNGFLLSRRKDIVLSGALCSKIAALYGHVSNAAGGMREKLDFIYAMLKIANKLLNTNFERGLACAIFVTILESIYVPEKEQKGLTKKFAGRITKTFGKNTEFQKRLEDFYDKRSTVLHGNSKKFPLDTVTMEEMSQLEEITCNSIIMFAGEPQKFTTQSLRKRSGNRGGFAPA